MVSKFCCACGARPVEAARLASRWSIEPALPAEFGARQHTPNIALRRYAAVGGVTRQTAHGAFWHGRRTTGEEEARLARPWAPLVELGL